MKTSLTFVEKILGLILFLYELTPIAFLAMGGFLMLPMVIVFGATVEIVDAIRDGVNVTVRLHSCDGMHWHLYFFLLIWSALSLIGMVRFFSGKQNHVLDDLQS